MKKKLRVKSIALPSEGSQFSTLLLAAAIAFITLFAWSLAHATEPAEKIVRAEKVIRTAQLQKIVADSVMQAWPSEGASERERALFLAPPGTVPHHSASPVDETLYRSQGRLGSRLD